MSILQERTCIRLWRCRLCCPVSRKGASQVSSQSASQGAPAGANPAYSIYLSLYQNANGGATQAQPQQPKQQPRQAPVSPSVPPKANPAPQTVPQKIYLRVPDMTGEVFKKAKNIVDIFNEGTIKVIFYDSSTAKYSEYSERMYYSQYAIKELKGIIGEDNVVLK